MKYYIAMAGRPDLAAIDAEARAGVRPRHAIGQLASRLSATVLQPQADTGTMTDTLASRLAGTPQTWALARDLRAAIAPGDVIFCADEAVGIPVAARCGGVGAKIMLFGHNLDRPRARAAIRLLSLVDKVDVFMAVSRKQTAFLRHAFQLGESKLLARFDQTDVRFFAPGAAERGPRPIIVSVGLEQRDYRTLAAATSGLDVDVRISGFSADTRADAKAFPPVMPANMSKAFYSWPDLQTLYRSADVVVVSLFPNGYAAGIQGLLEAVATGTPVIVTRTEGLAEYLDRPDLITSIAMGSPAAMRAAIQAKLADPPQARQQAAAARAHYLPRIDSDRYVEEIALRLEGLAARPEPD